MNIRSTITVISVLLALVAKAQGPRIVVPCAEEKKMQQARGLMDKLAARGAEGFETWLAASVTPEQRTQMRKDLQNAAKTVADLSQQHQLSVVIVYPEPDESIFRCRFIGDNKERFRLDLHYRTTECKPEIIGMRIDREPPSSKLDDLPPEPPPSFEELPFIIQH